MRKKLAALFLGLTITVGMSACTPDQFKSWLNHNGVDSSKWSEAQLSSGSEIATWWWQETIKALVAEAAKVSAEAEYHKYDSALSDASLARLRQCESGGNYNITSPGGAYRGAYQFSPSTWNAVAGRHFPALVGLDPAAAAPLHQDAMARALFMEMGRSPWPVCGQYI